MHLEEFLKAAQEIDRVIGQLRECRKGLLEGALFEMMGSDVSLHYTRNGDTHSGMLTTNDNGWRVCAGGQTIEAFTILDVEAIKGNLVYLR